MADLRKLYVPKCLQNIKYHTEKHHTCLNPAICRKKTSPDETCRLCKFYKFQKVEVADNPIRQGVDWGF